MQERILLPATVYPSTDPTIVALPTDDIFNGAHNYEVHHMMRFEPEYGTRYAEGTMPITFVKRNADGSWQPGLQSEQLLLILLDRHAKLNAVLPVPESQPDLIDEILEKVLAENRVLTKEEVQSIVFRTRVPGMLKSSHERFMFGIQTALDALGERFKEREDRGVQGTPQK